MGILSKLSKMIPANAAQDTADTFLMGVGGGVLGGGATAMMGGEDMMVPGAVAGLGGGLGARGLHMGLKHLLRGMSERDAAALLKRLEAEKAMPRSSSGDAMEIISMRGDDGQMHNYLAPRRK